MSEEPIRTKKLEFQYPEIPGLISIVMCVHNSEPYLRLMLDSIYAQTYKKFEVIVAYDTKTSDNSLEILKEYRDKYSLIIDYGDDSSIGFTRVRGARLARGEYLIYLDSDDFIIPTYLDDLIGCFIHFSEINIAYCGLYAVAESKATDGYLQSLTSTNTISLLDTNKAMNYFQSNKKTHFTIMGSSCQWLVRRKYLQEIECYFPNISMREDAVYVLQLLVNSQKIGHSSRIGYIYINHSYSETNRFKSYSQRLFEINQFYKLVDPLLELTENPAYYKRIFLKRKNESYQSIPKTIASSLRSLPYSEYRLNLEKEGITHLPINGGYTERLSCLCFNMSKMAYWMIPRIRNKDSVKSQK